MRNLLAVALCALAVSAPGQVVINEFVYDDSGTDDREFVELYNAGGSPVDISGWTLEGADEAWTAPLTGDNNPDFVIPAGTSIAPGGFYVLGSGLVANVDQIVGASNLWENSKEAIVLRDGSNAIVDAVAYEGNKSTVLDPSLFEGTPIWGNQISVDGTFLSWSRWVDGLDTNDNGKDFGQQTMSPGATNDVSMMPPWVCDDFEQWPGETDLICVAPSFVVPRVVDPQVPSASLPNTVPPSPDGGQCMIFWDPAGGGDAGFLLAPPVQDNYFECFVYLYTGHTAGESEQWSLGLRGTTGTFFNFPIGGTSNGNTGITWTYDTNDSGATLYLIDHGSGGVSNVIQSIAITSGVNDGWQRIRLSVSGLNIDANFGGTFGDPASGQVINGVASQLQTGTWYMGYREAVVGTTNAHGLLLDRLVLGNPCPPRYQTNTPCSSLVVEGKVGGIFYPAVIQVQAGVPFLADCQGCPGLPYDILVTQEPVYPFPTPPSFALNDGQIVNVNINAAPRWWLFSPGHAWPLFQNSFAPMLHQFVAPIPTVGSAQAVMLDPATPSGFSLSAPVEVHVN